MSQSLYGKWAVQVLEDRSIIAEYDENMATLKADIKTVQKAGEPSKDENAKFAGKMRRLIETIVNRMKRIIVR